MECFKGKCAVGDWVGVRDQVEAYILWAGARVAKQGAVRMSAVKLFKYWLGNATSSFVYLFSVIIFSVSTLFTIGETRRPIWANGARRVHSQVISTASTLGFALVKDFC